MVGSRSKRVKDPKQWDFGCPRCHGMTEIVSIREGHESVIRRRECLLCGLYFTTTEVVGKAKPEDNPHNLVLTETMLTCVNGHPYTKENTRYDNKYHRRHCIACGRERQARYRANKRLDNIALRLDKANGRTY